MSVPRPVLAVAAGIVLGGALVVPMSILMIDGMLVLAVGMGCLASAGVDGELLRRTALAVALATVLAASRTLLARMHDEPKDPWTGGLIDAIGQLFSSGNAIVGGAIAGTLVLVAIIVTLVAGAGRIFALVALMAGIVLSIVAIVGFVSTGTPFDVAVEDGSNIAIGTSVAMLLPAAVAVVSRPRGSTPRSDAT